MSDFELELAKFNDAVEELDEQIRELDAVGGDRWLVGTGVEYAIYLEFGTSDMDPKPFVRPALRNVASDVDEIARETDDPETLVQRIAFALEREIKQVITQKGLINTGTLRVSIRAVPVGSAGGLPDAADVEV